MVQDVFVDVAVGGGKRVNLYQEEMVDKAGGEITRMGVMGMMMVMMLGMGVMELVRNQVFEFRNHGLAVLSLSSSCVRVEG